MDSQDLIERKNRKEKIEKIKNLLASRIRPESLREKMDRANVWLVPSSGPNTEKTYILIRGPLFNEVGAVTHNEEEHRNYMKENGIQKPFMTFS